MLDVAGVVSVVSPAAVGAVFRGSILVNVGDVVIGAAAAYATGGIPRNKSL